MDSLELQYPSPQSQLLPSTELQPSNAILKTYTGEQIPLKRVLPVTVHYGQQTHCDLKLLVVSRPGPSLLGRDWLRVIRLEIVKVAASIPRPPLVTSPLKSQHSKGDIMKCSPMVSGPSSQASAYIQTPSRSSSSCASCCLHFEPKSR